MGLVQNEPRIYPLLLKPEAKTRDWTRTSAALNLHMKKNHMVSLSRNQPPRHYESIDLDVSHAATSRKNFPHDFNVQPMLRDCDLNSRENGLKFGFEVARPHFYL